MDDKECSIRRNRRKRNGTNQVALPFGEHLDETTSRWVMLHVSKVPSGLDCRCRCPACKADLVARHRKTSERASHFAHRGKAGCKNAFETMLHKVAKQIIADAKWLMLPPVTVKSFVPPRPLKPAKKFSADVVHVELKKDRIKPDVTAKATVLGETHTLYVEVRVHHACEPDKLAYLREHEMASIEIDLSHVKEIGSEEEIRNLVLVSADRDWLFNKHIAAEEAKLAVEADHDEAELTNQAVDIVAAYCRPRSSVAKPDAMQRLEEAGVTALLADMCEPGSAFDVADHYWQGAVINAFLLDPDASARAVPFSVGAAMRLVRELGFLKPEFVPIVPSTVLDIAAQLRPGFQRPTETVEKFLTMLHAARALYGIEYGWLVDKAFARQVDESMAKAEEARRRFEEILSRFSRLQDRADFMEPSVYEWVVMVPGGFESNPHSLSLMGGDAYEAFLRCLDNLERMLVPGGPAEERLLGMPLETFLEARRSERELARQASIKRFRDQQRIVAPPRPAPVRPPQTAPMKKRASRGLLGLVTSTAEAIWDWFHVP